MITVQDIVTLLEGLAPPALAESWDNVGLLCGDRAREVTNVLCSLDITEQVVAEATERGAQMIVAHHPVIFPPRPRPPPALGSRPAQCGPPRSYALFCFSMPFPHFRAIAFFAFSQIACAVRPKRSCR